MTKKTKPEVSRSFAKFLSSLGKLSDVLIKSRIRSLIVLSGSQPISLGELGSRAVNYYARKWIKQGKIELRGLYVYHTEFADAVKMKEAFEEKVLSKKLVEFEYAAYERSEKYLGATVQFLVMDLTKDLKPNDIGKLVGIVEGGGLILLLAPPWKLWDNFKTIFKETLTVPHFPEPRHVFIAWFKKKLLEHYGIGVYDADNQKIIKAISLVEKPKTYAKNVTIPSERIFPIDVYEHALTADQINVIKILENFYEKPKKSTKKVFVLTADRGRGKSCAIGIGIVGLLHLFLSKKIKPRFRALVTSPSPSNVQSLMMLSCRVLDKLGYTYNSIRRGGNLIEIRGERFSIEYWEPLNIPKLKGDIVIVDEAASLHVPLLYKILDVHNRLIFSTTIHGYEGSGRGFSVRFLRRLQTMENVELYKYEMSEPIRYNYNDPIEEWQFKTLLLDAEPAELTQSDLEDIESKKLIYVKIEPEVLFNKEEELRQLFGIYVLAHYRNEPDDLGMLADAPHHLIRAVKTASGKIVCSIQIAQEGPIDQKFAEELLRGGKIQGNIIPDRFLKHLRLLDFAYTTGWRIVRIATHPAVIGKGVGSWALEKIFEEVKERGLDWLGAGFGVTDELLRFWIKNGFSVVHISPDRNPTSGEYTVLVIKPSSEKTEKILSVAKLEFKLKFMKSLPINYRELEPEVVYLIINSGPYIYYTLPPGSLSPISIDRLWTYCTGPMTFEVAADLVFSIARLYWLTSEENRPRLSKQQELLLITKALQGLSWDEASRILGKPVRALQEIGHEIACIFFEFLTGLAPSSYKPGIFLSEYGPGNLD
ncbi:MAG: tRNA(Met) cytidine acetyltransferase TmcA [Desulfurococcaceae archaeon]